MSLLGGEGLSDVFVQELWHDTHIVGGIVIFAIEVNNLVKVGNNIFGGGSSGEDDTSRSLESDL